MKLQSSPEPLVLWAVRNLKSQNGGRVDHQNGHLNQEVKGLEPPNAGLQGKSTKTLSSVSETLLANTY